MNTIWRVCLMGALLAGSAEGQAPSRQPLAVHSQSGQFIVSRLPLEKRHPLASVVATNQQLIEVDPTLLVVSCERVKQAIWRELGLTAPWRGKVYVTLFPAAQVDRRLTLTAERFRDGWNYRLAVPNVVDRTRLLRGLVQVVLLEVANRRAAARSAELPPWLTVGLADELLATSETEFLFSPPRKGGAGVNFNFTVTIHQELDRLATLRTRLQEHPALTLQELSWPTESDLDGEKASAYRASAQVFVSELLRLRNGPGCFRAFLEELPQHLNWQTAFLKTFNPPFTRLLDVEKWWGLQAVTLGGRDLMRLWTPAESWQKLSAAVRVPAQVRPVADRLPATHTTIPLQQVIGQWDFANQTSSLRVQLAQLAVVRQRIAPELLPLVEAYHQLLERYLAERDKLGPAPAPGPTLRPRLRRLVEHTVGKLEELDKQLQDSRPAESLPVDPSGPEATVSK